MEEGNDCGGKRAPGGIILRWNPPGELPPCRAHRSRSSPPPVPYPNNALQWWTRLTIRFSFGIIAVLDLGPIILGPLSSIVWLNPSLKPTIFQGASLDLSKGPHPNSFFSLLVNYTSNFSCFLFIFSVVIKICSSPKFSVKTTFFCDCTLHSSWLAVLAQ